MPSLIVRNIDPEIKERLRVQAARHGRSKEAEVRDILGAALGGDVYPDSPENLLQAMRRLIDPIGGVELDIPPRGPERPLPTFE